MIKEVKVYVIDFDEVSLEEKTLSPDDPEMFMDKAEEIGSVYSLKGFQNAVNGDELNLTNSYILIR